MNVLLIAAIIFLALLLLICLIFLLRLKKDILSVSGALREIYLLNQKDGTNTNRMLTTHTFQKDMVELCNTVNQILENNKTIAMESERSVREFRQAITNISHDLRTPLTSAIGYMQMIKSDRTPPDNKNEYMTIVEQRLKYLVELMNHLFEYSQIVEGKNNDEKVNINICNELRNIASTFYQNFTEKSFQVNIDIPDAPIYVLGHVNSFKRIIQNLLQNVLAHGVDELKLSVYRETQEIVIQNKLVNPEQLDVESLFHRFYTADFSRTSGTTGLGLAIANELVLGMNGSIHASVQGSYLNICIHFEMSTHKNL